LKEVLAHGDRYLSDAVAKFIESGDLDMKVAAAECVKAAGLEKFDSLLEKITLRLSEEIGRQTLFDCERALNVFSSLEKYHDRVSAFRELCHDKFPLAEAFTPAEPQCSMTVPSDPLV